LLGVWASVLWPAEGGAAALRPSPGAQAGRVCAFAVCPNSNHHLFFFSLSCFPAIAVLREIFKMRTDSVAEEEKIQLMFLLLPLSVYVEPLLSRAVNFHGQVV